MTGRVTEEVSTAMANTPILLVCDDDEDDHVLIKNVFAEAGVSAEFRFTSSGLELIKYLGDSSHRRIHPFPDIILLDLNMPQMNGHDVLCWLKSHQDYRAIPVVIYSTSDDEDDIRKSYRAGANAYIVKCCPPEDLVEQIKYLLRSR
jgi:CheY-like chemotaxis protein